MTRNNAWPPLAPQQRGAQEETTVIGMERAQQNVDPLQLHGSDHPGLSFVTEQLTGKNYLSWSHAMLIALGAKTKIGFIDGSIEMPDMNSPEYNNWKKVDYMVISWILNSLSKDIRKAYIYVKSAKILWNDLRERYGESNGPLRYQIQKEMGMLVQGSSDISEYYIKMKRLWDEYELVAPTFPCDCERGRKNTVEEMNRRMIQFLMGLNDSFEHVRSQILLMEPLPSINKVYSMLQTVEKQREINLQFPDAVEHSAMMAKIGTGTGRNGHNQGFGRFTNSVKGNVMQRRSKEEKAKLTCEHCGYKGHDVSECFKLNGVPDWYKKLKEQRNRFVANVAETSDESYTPKKGNQVNSPNDMSAFMQRELTKFFAGKLGNEKMSGEKIMSLTDFTDFAGTVLEPLKDTVLNTMLGCHAHDWVLDSGASKHICCKREVMLNLLELSVPIVVYLPDGSTISVKHTGKVRITDSLTLTEVLFIPGFKYNLLSVGQLLQTNKLKCVFYSTHCIVQDLHSDAEVAIGRSLGKLYILSPTDCQARDAVCHVVDNKEFVLWHNRLGHPSVVALKHVKACNNSIASEAAEYLKHCEVCHLSKQYRLSFGLNGINSCACFELVHADLWGPYNEPTILRVRYMLTLVDDYSRCTWIYLVQHKGEVGMILRDFVKMIETQYKTHVQKFQTDNGSEFVGGDTQKLFAEMGIERQRSCSYTPQQNGAFFTIPLKGAI